MKKIKYFLLSLILVFVGSTFLLTGCDEYRKLNVTLNTDEVTVFLSDNPEENLFEISATVNGAKSGVSTDVNFEILSTQGIIEAYGTPTKVGDTTTAKYLALSKGKVQISVVTKEGNKTALCTVTVEEPLKSIGFTKESLALNRGTEKDVRDFIVFTPNNTSQTNIELTILNPDVDETNKIHINGTKILVDADSSVSYFTLQVKSLDNEEIVETVLVNVVDTINSLKLEYTDTSKDGYTEIEKVNDIYTLNLAQNVNDESMYKKLIKLKGFINFGEDIFTDKGYISPSSDYQIKVMALNETTNKFEPVELPFRSEYFEISKQFNDGSIQIQQIRKGSQTLKFVVDYAGHIGEFTTEIVLQVNVLGLPTQIEVLYSNESVDDITLFDNTGSGSVEGTSINLNVIGVNDEILNNEPVLINFKSDSEIKISVYNRFGVKLDLTNPITVANDCPLLISHEYATDESAPNDLKMVVTSVNYDKIFKSVDVKFIRGEISLVIASELRIPYNLASKEVEIQGLTAGFDKSLLKIYIADESIVKLDKDALLRDNKIVLLPQGKFGKTSFYILAPNGVRSRECKVTIFEELLDSSTIKVYGTTIKPYSVDETEHTIVLKTSSTYTIKYNINEIHDYLITGMSSIVTVENTAESQRLLNIVDGTIKTLTKTGSANLTVTLTGYNNNGELSKTLEYKFKIEVKAPLISATPNIYVATIYNLAKVTGYESLAKQKITFKVNPSVASFTKDDMSWVIKIGNEILQPMNVVESTSGSVTTTTHIFAYNNNIVYIETTSDNIQQAVVYSILTSESLVFDAICQIRQTFANENGKLTTTVNEDVSVTFTVNQPVKVSSIILDNVKKTTIAVGEVTEVKNSYTFDTRDMTIDATGKFTSGNEYVVQYTLLPANATIKELSVNHTQAKSDLEVSVDNVNQTITIKVNRQIDGETIIYIRSKDAIDEIVEQQIYLKVANGTINNEFEIENAEDIVKIHNSLNSHYILTADINLQSISNFEPIGTKDTPFLGSINGVHKITLGDTIVSVQHTIYNLRINRRQTDEVGNINYFGLFGFVGETGALLNINLNGVNINILDANGDQVVYVGALAGFSKGLIYNCSVVDGSSIQTLKAKSIFTEASTQVGITYRSLSSNKTTYIGGLVGMLVGIPSLNDNFRDNIDLIDGITTNFENNNAYVNIVATSTIETSAIIAGGLVGYNLGAHILNSANVDYSAVTSINTYSGTSMSNQNSVYGGLVGINLGGIENYTIKSYVKGLTYTGGLVGINMGQLVNNTILPIVRGKNYVGGLVGYNIYNDNFDVESLTDVILPNVYDESLNESDEFKISSTLYKKLFVKTNKININATYDIINKTYNLLDDSKYNSIYGNKVQFIDNDETISVYNTAIIGENFVGGLVGYNNQKAIKEVATSITYKIDETIYANSVYSYFSVGTGSNDRKIYNYDESNTQNRYFGDIVALINGTTNVGGLIGGANNVNIIKGFVNANITTKESNTGVSNIGGLVGVVGTSTQKSITRIVDSHTNGIVNSISGTDNIGSFIGDASNIYKFENGIVNINYVNSTTTGSFYNIETSYSVLKQSLNTSSIVTSTSFVKGFSGVDTTSPASMTIGNVKFDGYKEYAFSDGTNNGATENAEKFTYDNLTAVNSFYIGFKINYLKNASGGIDYTTGLSSASIDDIDTIEFTYEDAVKGYTELADGSKFSYFNAEYVENSNRTIMYSNNKFGEYARDIKTNSSGNVDGIARINYVNVTSIAVGSDSNNNLFDLYYVETENADEDGFGSNTETYTLGDKTVNVINKQYNWYQNVYEYENSSNLGTKYKAYNGLPLVLNLRIVYRIPDEDLYYDNKISLVIDLPPMGIDVSFNENKETTFIRNISETEKEIVLTFTELDSKYYNNDGTINSFNNQTEFDKTNYSMDIKNSIANENTYKLKDVINISALPKFVGVSKLEYKSVNGLIKFGYDVNGNETLQVLGAGHDQIVITSKYNKEVTYTANVNIISKLTNLQLLKNKRSSAEISSLEIVKDVETSFYADINSTFSKILSSTNYVFDLVQRQNLGVRYYFTTPVAGSLTIYHDSDASSWSYILNGRNIVCEEVQVNGETKYLYYVDIASSEISILGNEAFNEYSTILAVPYIILDNENFFIVETSKIEELANSYTKNALGLAGTFAKSNELIKPLQIKVYNETFNLKVDKTSVEFSAYTKPIVTVTMGTDNFDDNLFFIISNIAGETREINAESSNLVTYGNLTIQSFEPISNITAREKTYKFELSVLKNNNQYVTITDDTNFVVTFYTKENGEIKFVKSCNVTLLPQPINEISVLHYPSSEYEEKEVNGEIVFVPKTNEVAFNNIIPGYMGLLKINLSPYYGNVTSINIISSTVNGKTINFEQLVYFENEDIVSYQTSYPQAERLENGIIALPRSIVDVYDNYIYNGNLYIRTILPSNTLTGSIFTVTITVYAYANGNLISYPSKTIELEAITPPGIYLSYKNSTNGVVARGTDNIINLTGDGIDGAFIDFNEYTTVNIYNGGVEYGTNGKVRVRKNIDGTYTLTVASELPQGSTINLVAYTERTINNKLYTSKSTLTLKVADFVVENITVENVVDGVFQSILNQTKRLNVALKDVSYNPYIPQINTKLKEFAENISIKLNSSNANSTWYRRVYNADGSFSDENLVDKDYGTFVIRCDADGSMYIRNTSKNSYDTLVAKAIINYGFGSTSNIILLDPNVDTIPDTLMDDTYTVELECEFTFNVQRNTNDETPEPITNAEQFINMEAGINYILLEDITLTNYRPISTEIASFDGNGYIITIKSFDTSVETNEEGEITGSTTSINLGLFDTIAEGTIIKNVTVELLPLPTLYNVNESSNNSTQDLLIDATDYNNVNFGFIAAENNGSITNAQVVNDKFANEIRNEREQLLQSSKGINKTTGQYNYTARNYTDVENRSISIVKVMTKADVSTSRIAGLVAINNGYITNSRVENITINGSGYVAGLVVQNNNTISSSYYKGANLLNQSSELIANAGTAGLVVFNESNATIQYCYTMSREGWSYNYTNPNEEDNVANGSISFEENIYTKDITGIGSAEKNLFTGVYNSSTLVINDSNGVVNGLTETSEVYQSAINSLRKNTDIATLRAVNSAINVDTDAAGFVYQNNGTISNSYANMLVSAAHSAGFVFTSGESGIIEDCYSLSSVRIESDAHSPFTGKTVNDVENSYNAKTTNISYSHYLKVDQTIKFTYNPTGEPGDASYDKNEEKSYTITLLDKFYDTGEPATSLEAEELYSYNSFQGYAFNTDFELNTDILRSVWFIPSKMSAETYSTYDVIKNNFKHSYYAPSRPELVSANLRTLSIRYLTSDYSTSETLSYEYVESLVIGESIRNPYLVYNATTFNDYGTLSRAQNSTGGSQENVNKNYLRFIADISFEGNSVTDIKAETYNIDFAGDIDGNGMYINDLKLIAESQIETTQTITHLGLFGKLYETKNDDGTTFRAIVRNLNINVSSIDGTGVMYVGTLAGEMIDASAYNIRVYGDGVYVNGQNAVGGIVGKISGNSELVNISTNISVSATNKSTTVGNNFSVYDGTEITLKAISYSGGIAGIADVNDRGSDVKTAQKYARLRKLDVYGNTTISGDIVGGIFGFVGTKSNISDSHFTITTTDATPRLVARYSAGGLAGELRGKIERSYITHDVQSTINEEIKANLNKTTHTSTGSDKIYNNLFNGSPLATSYYIGGIAGINLGGTISDSYSNVNVINGVSYYAGGVVGVNAGGTIKSVYTTGSVYANVVGGFIGLVVNGTWLKEGLNQEEGGEIYIDATTLNENGFIINNIKEIIGQLSLGSLVMNSIVSANIWRSEDLDKVNYDYTGSFAGKFIDNNKVATKIISTSSDSSREMSELNVFTNAKVKTRGSLLEIKEIGTINNEAGYNVNEVTYPTDTIPTTIDSNTNQIKYLNGRFGVVYKEESTQYYYYSRLKTYGSLRTLEEIINRNIDYSISKTYESAKTNIGVSGDFVPYKENSDYNLPKIYKGWSSIYWEGTALNNAMLPDSDHVFPSLIARPNVAVVRVYDENDLQLIYTLLSSEFILMNDIEISGDWTPVGTATDPFTGSIHSDFDSSNNYNSWTIKNVSITVNEGNSAGFFGTISGAEIHDFNVNITKLQIDKSKEYELNVGGLVGNTLNEDISKIYNVCVIGGKQVPDGEEDDETTVKDFGTSGAEYKGTSVIYATNISTLGGVVGSASSAEINNISAINLVIYAGNNTDPTNATDAGALNADDGDYNAIGGVIGYYKMFNETHKTLSNIVSKNIKIGNNETPKFNEPLYVGGAIGYSVNVYLRNVRVTQLSIIDNYVQNNESEIYVGGIAGQHTGIAFNTNVVNDSSRFIEVTLTTSRSIYVGGAFGQLSSFDSNYEETPNYIGSTPIRSDDNPFGKITGLTNYSIQTISNSLITDINIIVRVNNENATSMVGGVIGDDNADLYNLVSYGSLYVSTDNETYVGGLVGNIRNKSIKNGYSNRNITIENNNENNNMLYVGGTIGRASGIVIKNLVSYGELEIRGGSFYFNTGYIGGLIGLGQNISLETSVSNANINIEQIPRSESVLHVGGFIGRYEQTNGSGQDKVHAYILNSYSTGTIYLESTNYQGGGLGGFVGSISTTTNKTALIGNENADISVIKNCYTVSRVVTKNSVVYYDNQTKGGFVGNYNQTFEDILVNCYFNKETFSIYENSTNALVTNRYNGGTLYVRDFGVGLTLDQMLYSVANKDGEFYSSVIANNFSSEIANNINNKPIFNETLNIKVSTWYFENNKYPLLNFVFEAFVETIPDVNNVNDTITQAIYYNYVPTYLKEEKYNSKYNLQTLLTGSIAFDFALEDSIRQDFDTNGSDLSGSDLTIYYNKQFITNTNNANSIQREGSIQNPKVISDTSIDFNANTDGKYTYDFTNQAVIINGATAISNDYKANGSKLQNATILFKDIPNSATNSFKIMTVDKFSLIYGLKETSSTTNFVTNNGTIKNVDIFKSSGVLVTVNNGIIEDVKCNSSSQFLMINVNNAIVNDFEYTLTSTQSTPNYAFITTNNGSVRYVTLNYSNDYSSGATFDNNELKINGAKDSVINITFKKISLKDSTIGQAKAYKYYDAYGNDLVIYDRNINSEKVSNLPTSTSTFYTESKGNVTRTFVTVGSNTRAHAIDLFGEKGANLRTNETTVVNTAFDFANDWIILTGIDNNNLPILRSTLKANYYDTDIDSSYYWINESRNAVQDTDYKLSQSGSEYNYDILSEIGLGYVASVINSATNGTFNINITTTINLANKLWTPINVASGVIVRLTGSGVDAGGNVDNTDQTKDRRIQNLSVVSVNQNVGFFGTVYGKVNVSNILFEYGYVAGINGYKLTSANNIINTDYNDNQGNIISLGSVVGAVSQSSRSNVGATFNRVGNQYVYVAGYNGYFCVSGLVGANNVGTVGIKDSYVNSPFMVYNFSAGLIMSRNSSAIIYVSNTYVANCDVYNCETSNERKYTYYAVSNNIASSGSFTDATAGLFQSNIYNYYISSEETSDSSKSITGTSLMKLRTGVLPLFDWTTNWTRLQGANDGLPYNLTTVEYWINDGASAVTGTDYTVSGSTYNIITAKGLAWVSYMVDNGETFEGKTLQLSSESYDLSGKVWTPIGSSDRIFKGTVKSTYSSGTSKIKFINVSSYYSKKDGRMITDNYIGLFGYVQNANISGINVQSSIISGNINIGAIVGYAENSTITNVSVTDNGTTGEKTYVNGINSVGGIVGLLKNVNKLSTRLDAVVANTVNYAYVYGNNSVAGIVGYNDGGVVELSENYGVVTAELYESNNPQNIGGIVGYSSGSIYEVINNAEVIAYSGLVTSSSNIGGIVGYLVGDEGQQLINALNRGNIKGSSSTSTGLICGCFNGSNPISTSGNGPQIVMAYSGANKYINNTITTTNKFIGSYDVGSSALVGTTIATDNNLLKFNSLWIANAEGGITFSPVDSNALFSTKNTYSISDVSSYSYVNELVNRRAYYNYENGMNKYDVSVTSDISDNITNNYNTTSDSAYAFQGKFHSSESGTQRKISIFAGRRLEDNYGGLFSAIKNAEIIDINVNKFSIITLDVSYVGIVSGVSYNSKITNVSITDSISLVGSNYVGGICGYAENTEFSNCKVYNEDSQITGESYVGGFVGYMKDGQITSSNASAYCNNVKIVVKGNYGGGIVGYMYNSTITNCNNYGEIDGDTSHHVTESSGGISGVGGIDGDLEFGVIGGESYYLIFLGGIVGFMENTSRITSCANSANVEVGERAGGIAGGSKTSTIENCSVSSTVYASSRYCGGIVGYSVSSTIKNNTYSGTAKSYSYIGGIVGYGTNDNITSNTMNGNIYVYRSDSDDGKVKKNANSFGFGYSITYNDDAESKLSYTTGSYGYFGKLNIVDYNINNNIQFICGNNKDLNTTNSNTINTYSILRVQDTFVRYNLGITTSKANDADSVYPFYWQYNVYTTLTIYACQFKDHYITGGSETDNNGNYADSNYTKSIEESFKGWAGQAFSIGTGYYQAYENLVNEQIPGREFDFTGTW